MINLGLSRIGALVSQLPTRQTWKAIHIAGTNGKGSVAASLSSLFIRCSSPKSGTDTELKIGRFTSPHMVDRWDCITINDQPVSESVFLRVEREVKSYAENVEWAAKRAIEEEEKKKAKILPSSSNEDNNTNDDATVTEFELLTATAFEIFSRQNCQVAIIECGLGGRLDATNVLASEDVVCSVITKIGLDHMGMLGNTIEEIAQEKAGIVKEGVSMVVDGTNPPNVIQAITEVTRRKHVVPLLSGFDSTTATSTTSSQSSSAMTWNISSPDLSSRKIPPHQQDNLLVALEAFATAQSHLQQTLDFSLFQSLPLPLPPSSPSTTATTFKNLILPRLLRDVQKSYPARLQHLFIDSLLSPNSNSKSQPSQPTTTPITTQPQYNRKILLDGAHNPQSARVLREYIDNSIISCTSSSSSPSFSPSSPSNPTTNPNPNAGSMIFVLAMTHTKPIHEILSILLRPQDKLVCCRFSRVDGMPWIHPVDPRDIARVAGEVVDEPERNVSVVDEGGDVVDALRLAVGIARDQYQYQYQYQYQHRYGHRGLVREVEGQGDERGGGRDVQEGKEMETGMGNIVVAGSLYLASDLLRALRDGEGSLKKRMVR